MHIFMYISSPAWISPLTYGVKVLSDELHVSEGPLVAGSPLAAAHPRLHLTVHAHADPPAAHAQRHLRSAVGGRRRLLVTVLEPAENNVAAMRIFAV